MAPSFLGLVSQFPKKTWIRRKDHQTTGRFPFQKKKSYLKFQKFPEMNGRAFCGISRKENKLAGYNVY